MSGRLPGDEKAQRGSQRHIRGVPPQRPARSSWTWRKLSNESGTQRKKHDPHQTASSWNINHISTESTRCLHRLESLCNSASLLPVQGWAEMWGFLAGVERWVCRAGLPGLHDKIYRSIKLYLYSPYSQITICLIGLNKVQHLGP